jgi:2-(1,2-epoxy-1,2-dihydrophenyl)acetyl-CoA isomerase
MSEALILVSRLAGADVAVLALNRPAAMNSFTTAMHTELLAALNAAAADPSVRCVILTGQGRGFCAGQDLSDPAAAPGQDLGVLIGAYYKPLVQRIRSMPVPVIAAVNGVAAGAGANLALCCDLVLAASSANFIQAFAKIGLLPDTGGTWLLPCLVGHARAMGLAMLGDKLSSADAAAMGLIWRSVADDQLMAEAEALAQKLAHMPLKALVATRHALLEAQQGMSLDEALDLEARQQTKLGAAHDFLEGVDAFRNKRAPVFTDR